MSNFETDGYLKNGCGLIAEERERQMRKLGWSESHDDSHDDEALRDAAIAYAMVCDDRADNPPNCWPFDPEEFHYSPYKARNLVKAGALLAAEIDRLYRKFQKECNEITLRDYGFECFDDMDAYDLSRVSWVEMTPEEFVTAQFKNAAFSSVEDLEEKGGADGKE